MAGEKKQGEYFYNQKWLHFVLVVFSGLFLVGTLLSVKGDYDRQWRHYQGEFRRLEIDKTHADMEKMVARRDAKLDEMKKSRDEMAANARKHADEITRMKAERDKLDGEIYRSNQAYQFAKADLDALKYHYPETNAEAVLTGRPDLKAKAKDLKEELDKKQTDANAKFNANQKLLDRKAEVEKQIAQYEAPITAMEKAIAQRTADYSRDQRKMERIGHSGLQGILNDYVRNSPMLDFISPNQKIEQVVLNDIKDDFNFAVVPKIDRCMTCHIAINKKGYEDQPNPLKTHPNLDLYLSDNSPHPKDKIGCTVCHNGNGHATDFQKAVHTPHSEEQQKEWEKKYSWHPEHHWDTPMTPMQYVQANCFACHKNAYEIPTASRLLKGQMLYERLGCIGCHKVQWFEESVNNRKPGFDLSHIKEKLNPQWTLKWVDNPKEFRPTTRMPQIFHLSNMADPDNTAKENTIIHGIVAYLFENSKPLDMVEPPGPGDKDAGAEVIKKIGCAACHNIKPLELESNEHGPDLSAVGSKVDKKWIYNWVKNPSHYFPGTLMPSLRLSDTDANNVSEYLSSLKNDDTYVNDKGETVPTEFAKKKAPEYSDAAARALFHDFLGAKESDDQINRDFDAMNEHDRLLFIGKKGIARQGCFGCHNIPGFETENRIGTELTYEGSKDIEKLDFGLLAKHDEGEEATPDSPDKPKLVNYTKREWFKTKLLTPRIYDWGKVLRYDEHLKMPKFNLSDDDVDALVTLLLGLTKTNISGAISQTLNDSRKAITSGREVIEKYNCVGCHQLGLFQKMLSLDTTDFENKIHWATHDVVVEKENPDDGSTTRITLLKRHDLIRGDKKLPGSDETTNVVEFLKNSGWKAVEGFGADEGNIAKYYSAQNFAPPLLRLEGERTRYEWLYDFLRHPYQLRPQVEVRMPTFPWRSGEIDSVIGFFANMAHEPWPLDVEDNPTTPGQLIAGHTLFGTRGTPEFGNSMQCNQCHPAGLAMPPGDKSTWGPNLAMAQYRLKPRWLHKWLFNPQYYMPGVAMPAFFYDVSQEPANPVWPDSQERIENIIAYLTHLNTSPVEWRFETTATLSAAATPADQQTTETATASGDSTTTAAAAASSAPGEIATKVEKPALQSPAANDAQTSATAEKAAAGTRPNSQVTTASASGAGRP